MANKLKQHFPMIRDREEIIAEIHSKQELLTIFNDWNEEGQKQFLDFCTGIRGVKLLYDQFFKEIINPDSTPERLEELISLLLQEKVTILKVLPTDSARIAAESSLLILDIVVQHFRRCFLLKCVASGGLQACAEENVSKADAHAAASAPRRT